MINPNSPEQSKKLCRALPFDDFEQEFEKEKVKKKKRKANRHRTFKCSPYFLGIVTVAVTVMVSFSFSVTVTVRNTDTVGVPLLTTTVDLAEGAALPTSAATAL